MTKIKPSVKLTAEKTKTAVQKVLPAPLRASLRWRPRDEGEADWGNWTRFTVDIKLPRLFCAKLVAEYFPERDNLVVYDSSWEAELANLNVSL